MLGDHLLLRSWLLVRQELPEPEHTPAEVRDLADEIMSRPEYREPAKPLLQRILDWLSERLADAVSGLSLGGALPTFVGWLILAALVGAVALLVVWTIRRGNWGRAPRRRREDATVILASDAHRSPADWLAEAVRHESEGRWREGLLCRYRSLVTQLVARGAIAELVGRTAGEYVQDVRSRWPDAAPPFVAATDLFEAAWFGGAETGAEERDRFASLAERTLAVLTSERVAAESVAAESVATG